MVIEYVAKLSPSINAHTRDHLSVPDHGIGSLTGSSADIAASSELPRTAKPSR